MKLLVDQHISPRIIAAFQKAGGKSEIIHMKEWHGGAYAAQHGESDLPWLRAAGREQWIIVTGDRNTLLGELFLLHEEGGDLPGFAAVDPEHLADVGWIGRKLKQLEEVYSREEARNVQVFL